MWRYIAGGVFLALAMYFIVQGIRCGAAVRESKNRLAAYGVCHCDAAFTNFAGGTVSGGNIRRGVPGIQAAYIPLSWAAIKDGV